MIVDMSYTDDTFNLSGSLLGRFNNVIRVISAIS